MAEILKLDTAHWSNFHGTRERDKPDHRAIFMLEDDGKPAQSYLAASATAYAGLIDEARQAGVSVTALGSSWSFSDLVSGGDILLETSGANVIFEIAQADMAGGSGVDPEGLALASAGATVGLLNRFLESRGRSLATSGAHDGQTMVGMLGTGTHGSVIDFGGFQNQIRGVHLVTGTGDSVWIERGPRPILDPQYVAKFADRRFLDNGLFEAALVHLGGLGIVNAVLIESVPLFELEVLKTMAVLGRDAIGELERGEFRSFCARLGYDREPYFVEVVIDPFLPFRPAPMMPAAKALITVYFKLTDTSQFRRVAGTGPVDDILRLIVKQLIDHPDRLPTPTVAALARMEFAKGVTSGGPLPKVRWSEASPPFDPHNVMGVPVPLHNDALAIPRERLLEALSVGNRAFLGIGGGHVVWTLRFVSACAGTLAFTRFHNTTVINMDGLRSDASTDASAAAIAAIEAHGIPISQHWGKMGRITPDRFAREYDLPNPPDPSKAEQWRHARSVFLQANVQPVFASEPLKKWGLA